MRFRFGLAALALASASAFAVGAATGADAQPTPATAPASAPAPAGDAARGKALFTGTYGCWECHGSLGQGNLSTAPRLAPSPLPFAALNAYVRKPGGEMPSYSETILSDKDLADIYAYLKSIPASKPASSIPLLSGANTNPK